MVPVERLIHGQVCNRCGGYRDPKRTPLLHRWRMMLISLSKRNPSFLLLLIALHALSLITQHYPPVDWVRVQVPVCWKVDSTWRALDSTEESPAQLMNYRRLYLLTTASFAIKYFFDTDITIRFLLILYQTIINAYN